MAGEVVTQKRIVWADLYKGLLIGVMVLGHSGVGGLYALQFLLAAFFIVSGYLTNFEKGDLFPFAWKRFHALMIPYVATGIAFFCLVKLWMMISSDTMILQSYVPDWDEWRVVWRRYGDTQVDILGATWFLPVLFFSVMFIKLLVKGACRIFKKPQIVYPVVFLVSLAVFLIGVRQLSARCGWYANFALVGQFFVFLGAVVRRFDLTRFLLSRKWIPFLLLPITGGIMYYFAGHPHWIEFAGRKVTGNLFLGIVSALNGTLFCFAISQVLSDLTERRFAFVRAILTYVGENTMGVIIFHFLFFKVVFLILIALGVQTWPDIRNLFIQNYEIACRWSPLFVVIGIAGSCLVWKLLTSIPVVRFFLGVKKPRA